MGGHTLKVYWIIFSDSKNSTPEPESEDSQPKEQDEEKDDNTVVLQPPTATTTSTLGLSCLCFFIEIS